jgi:hypothetical protein
MSIRQIARQFGHSRRTVRHALVHADPQPEPLTRNRTAPKLPRAPRMVWPNGYPEPASSPEGSGTDEFRLDFLTMG